jgi:uncharacterized protein YbjQ (UPF0145 family)
MIPEPFTSDLSVDEVLLIEDCGFDPVRLVLATTHWHAGWQWGAWGQNMEMNVLTAAMNDARHDAMSKVVKQLVQHDCDGVLGMRVTAKHRSDHVEFVAIGTGVRARTDRPKWRVHDRPFTSALSGQDFWSLTRAGYAPRALVVGNCVYHVAHQGLAQWFSRIGANVELETFTQAMYEARELAMERMQDEAMAAGAEGVVGVTVHEGPYGWGSHVIEFFALGTAVSRVGDAAPEVGLRFDLSI